MAKIIFLLISASFYYGTVYLSGCRMNSHVVK